MLRAERFLLRAMNIARLVRTPFAIRFAPPTCRPSLFKIGPLRRHFAPHRRSLLPQELTCTSMVMALLLTPTVVVTRFSSDSRTTTIFKGGKKHIWIPISVPTGCSSLTEFGPSVML